MIVNCMKRLVVCLLYISDFQHPCKHSALFLPCIQSLASATSRGVSLWINCSVGKTALIYAFSLSPILMNIHLKITLRGDYIAIWTNWINPIFLTGVTSVFD